MIQLFQTLSPCSLADTDRKTFLEQWTDPNTGIAFQSNVKALAFDLTMWLIVGNLSAALLLSWYDDLEEDASDDFVDGIMLSAANIAVKSVSYSFLDFNFIESISSPIFQWSPFTFEYIGRVLKQWASVPFGEKDIWDAVVGSTNVTKQFKPMFDTIKPEWVEE